MLESPQNAMGIGQELAAGLAEDGKFWQEALYYVPWGVAALDAQTGITLWVNATLARMLNEAVGSSNAVGHTPRHYLPKLERDEWERAQHYFHDGNVLDKTPLRIQFVHDTTRNITYWEWRLQPVLTGRYLLLTVQNVTDTVMNERMLASAGSTEKLARQRAEALVRLSRLVSESTTVPDILQAIVKEAAAYFESNSAVVLLCENNSFQIGYSIGLSDAEANAEFLQNPQNTLAMQAVTQRQALAAADTTNTTSKLPLLAGGKRPGALVTAPIQQGESVYGAVSVYFDAPRTLTLDELDLLTAFADQIGVAFHKADLHEQVANQKRQLQSIFDNAPVNIVLFDTDFRIVAINQSATRHYWEGTGSPIGRRYDALLHNIPETLFPSVLAGKPFHASHYVYRIVSGRDAVCDTSLLPLRDEAEQVVGLLLLSFEVTELVQARQAAEEALTAVQAAQTQMVQMEKMRAVGELASGVAHDLNNALMAILGYTELAEESLDDRETLISSLRIIEKAASDASSTVRRLQNFARQRVAAPGEPINVNLIIQDVVEMTRPRWRDEAQKQGRHYQVETHLLPLPPVLGEASGLREVLINMIHNALDAMPNGGNLMFSTRIQKRADTDKEEAIIEIADSGKGMTPEVMARIFDPFFTTRGVEGTGLGLAVSWTILQRHGGQITVESEPGRGTHFFIHLPITHEAGDVVAPIRAVLPATQGVPILVVDDEPFVASIITSILTRHGHRVTTADSGKRALELLREPGADFRLLITDHGMPGMTGLELIAELRKQGLTLPIVMLTGWGQSLVQNHAEAEMPDIVLGKPIHQTALLEAVTQVLREQEIGNRE